MAATQFIVEGGHRLLGTIRPAGNKNAALPIIAASLLTDQPVTLKNVPRIRDVETLVERIGLQLSVLHKLRMQWHVHIDLVAWATAVDDAVEAMSSLMEPIIMVVLGTLIGGMVVAMYLPIFKIGAVV